LEAEKAELARKYPIDSEVIEVVVGNQVSVTMRSTVCKFEGSCLAALFSGRHPLKTDSNGRFVIDRSPKTFGFVLEFLKYGRMDGVPREVQRRLQEDFEFFGLTKFLPPVECPSSILDESMFVMLKGFLLPLTLGRLLYSCGEKDFKAGTFHSKCDGAGATLIIIQDDKGNVFGGYNPLSWNPNDRDVVLRSHCSECCPKAFHDGTPDHTAPDAWLFSLRNPSGSPQKILPNGRGGEIFRYQIQQGPCFGSQKLSSKSFQHDLTVYSVGDARALLAGDFSSVLSTNLGVSFRAPNGDPLFLTGAATFKVAKMEVFAIND